MLVTPADVEAAASRIGPYVRTTPVVEVAAGELGLTEPVALKLELLQHTGSFKPRGAFNRVLRADVPAAGLIAASGGNHGAAVAHVAARLGHHAEVFVPSTSPAMKRDRIAALGADVRVIAGYYDDAQAAADERASETGALLVHPYDHADVVAGQGTMGRELERQAGPLDTVVVATGGGGFVGGQAAWFAGRVRVVSVEPATSRCLHAALEAGRPVPVEVEGLAADSLGAAQLGGVAWEAVKRYVDRAVLVDDEAIRAAQRAIWDGLRLVAEPGGAAALAALRTGAYQPAPGERVAVVVCGANCDPTTVTA
jgi:threonine dehydratase